MRAVPPTSMILVLILAGCLGEAPSPAEPPEGSPQDLGDEQGTPGSKAAAGAPPSGANRSQHLPDEGPLFGPAVNVSKERAGAEPMLGVGPEGTVFYTGTGPGDDGLPEQTVWRSTDGGTSFEDVTPVLPTASRGGLDNALAVGPEGTVYYLNAVGQTAQMFRSDDGGDTWLPLAPPTPPAATHRTWIEPGEEGLVHFAGLEAFPSNTVWYQRSEDRGTGWGPPGLVGPTPNMVSELAAAPGGQDLYMVLEDTGTDAPVGAWTLSASHDGGLTWELIPMWTPDTERTTAFMPLAVDADGTLYFLWAEEEGGTSLLHYAYSTDGGQTFSDALPIGDPEGSQTLAWMDVRAPGELGVVTYAADEPGHPSEVEGPWYAAYTFVDQADTAHPETYTTRLTSWPVHQGPICLGVICSEGGRELLDFAWIEFGPEDRAHVAFASSQWSQPSAFPVFAVESQPFTPPGP